MKARLLDEGIEQYLGIITMNYAEQSNSTSGVMAKDGLEQFDTRAIEWVGD